MRAAKKQSEKHLQRECIKWFRSQYPKSLITHLNPAASASSEQEGYNLGATRAADGVVPGLPDLFVFDGGKGANGLGIELKIPNKSPLAWKPRSESIFGGKGCYFYQKVDPQNAKHKPGEHLRKQIRMAARLNKSGYLTTFAWDLPGFMQIVNMYFEECQPNWTRYPFKLKCRYTGQTEVLEVPLLCRYIEETERL